MCSIWHEFSFFLSFIPSLPSYMGQWKYVCLKPIQSSPELKIKNWTNHNRKIKNWENQIFFFFGSVQISIHFYNWSNPIISNSDIIYFLLWNYDNSYAFCKFLILPPTSFNHKLNSYVPLLLMTMYKGQCLSLLWLMR